MRIPNPMMLVPALTSLCVCFEAGGAEPIKRDDFAALHRLIKPQEDEQSWTAIPWGENLWEARHKAAAEGKPILLWEMDGHPLGCT